MSDPSITNPPPTTTARTAGTDDLPLVRGTGELLAVVPHLLGYVPDRSLVIIATRPVPTEDPRATTTRAEVVMSLRTDLPREHELGDLGAGLACPLLELGPEPTMLHVFCYDVPDGAERYLETLAGILRNAASTTAARLFDLVEVDLPLGRQRPLVRAGGRCDDGWLPVPEAVDVPAAADLVWRGRAPVGSRAELLHLLRRPDEVAVAETDRELELLLSGEDRAPAGLSLAAVTWWLEGALPTIRAEDRAAATALLHDVTVRDAMLSRWLPDLFPGAAPFALDDGLSLDRWVRPWSEVDTALALDRLLTLCRSVPVPLTAPWWTTAGLLAWSEGQGTIANACCDLALEADETYSMAQLLRRCLDQGLRPPREEPV